MQHGLYIYIIYRLLLCYGTSRQHSPPDSDLPSLPLGGGVPKLMVRHGPSFVLGVELTGEGRRHHLRRSLPFGGVCQFATSSDFLFLTWIAFWLASKIHGEKKVKCTVIELSD